MRPVTDIPDYFGDVQALRRDNEALQARLDDLTAQARASGANLARNEELDRISHFADTAGFTIVPAQVIGIGPAQSFSQTVTIDAGRRDGVVPDLTVVNSDGLVGRVISATATTATVLLIVDADSTVGGRLSDSMELGFLTGDDSLSRDGHLELSLVDHAESPEVDDVVISWGSRNNAPYVAGVPIGRVTSVRSSPAALTETASISPFVDFSSLDVVGVVTRAAAAAPRQDTASGSPGGIR
jgi:rod shape-determining protein MreC